MGRDEDGTSTNKQARDGREGARGKSCTLPIKGVFSTNRVCIEVDKWGWSIVQSHSCPNAKLKRVNFFIKIIIYIIRIIYNFKNLFDNKIKNKNKNYKFL